LKWPAYFWFALSGIFLGLGFHTYIAFRVAPLIFLAVGLSFVFSKKGFLKNNWKVMVAFSLIFLVVLAPLFWYFMGNFNELIYRSGSVSIFNAPGMSPLGAFWKSLSTHLSAFFVFGDHNPRHNYNDQPLLPHVWAALFALGFVISFWEIIKTVSAFLFKRRFEFFKNKLERSVFFSKFSLNQRPPKENFEKNRHSQTVFLKNSNLHKNDLALFHISVLAQSMFWMMILPGALSAEGIPHSLRIIGTIPAVFLMMVLALEYFWNLKNRISDLDFEAGKKIKILLCGVVIFALYGGLTQVYIYFSKWATDTRTEGGYERKLYNLGLLVKDLPIRRNNYIITAQNTTIYAEGKKSSLKTTEYVGYPASQKYLFLKPLEKREEIFCDDPQIVFLESDQWLRDQYKGLCPSLSAKRYSFDNGKYLFWVINGEK
jgi:hypothetical protein